MSRYTKCKTVNTNKRLPVFPAFLLQLRGCHLNHQCGRKCPSEAPIQVVNVGARHTICLPNLRKSTNFLFALNVSCNVYLLSLWFPLFIHYVLVLHPKTTMGLGCHRGGVSLVSSAMQNHWQSKSFPFKNNQLLYLFYSINKCLSPGTSEIVEKDICELPV